MHLPRALLLFATAIAATIRVAGADAPVHLGTAVPELTVPAGGTATLRVLVEITAPYHIYSTEQQANASGLGPPATELALKTSDPITFAGAARTSPPHKQYDPNFGMDLLTLSGRAWIDVPVRAAATLKPGAYLANVVVTYQACDDQTCLPPADVELPVSFKIAPAGAASAPASPTSQK